MPVTTPSVAAAAPASRTTVRPPADGLMAAIGDTPLIRLRRLPARADLQLYVKFEAANPGGSAKARTAASVLTAALADGRLRPGGTVVESSSGNMGVGLAQACAAMGLRFVCVTDVRASRTAVATMRALGARVEVVTEPDPATGELLPARLARVAELRRRLPDAFWPDQYANPANPAAHRDGTMREIDAALGGQLDAVFVGTSTTGTLRGCGDHRDAAGRDTLLVAVDAEGSALFGGASRARALPGLGAGAVPPLAAGARFDRLVRVDEVDCVRGCRRLARAEGLLVGASGGGLVTAFERLAPELAAGARCVLVAVDGGAGYLDTVYDDEWVHATLGAAPDTLLDPPAHPAACLRPRRAA